ncbi:MAG: SET domain-containing protein [Chitinophagaceae bacterium]|nr:SET domain-containing protein [Chitinophagaceae bacterium]
MHSEFLYIDEVKDKGRAVFAGKKIRAGTVIETSPVIVMSGEERSLLDQTLLHDYIFVWGENKDQCCMALGYVAVYNHSYRSNCEYFMNYKERTIEVKTIRDIRAGEELTINYNGDWNNPEKVWFDVRE